MRDRAFRRTGWLAISVGLVTIALAGGELLAPDATAAVIRAGRHIGRACRRSHPRHHRRRPARRHHVGRYDAIIHEYSTRYRVEPALVKAVIQVESGFDPGAVSRRGARGLMQLMPAVARSHGVRNAHDPRQNIQAGVRELRALLDRFHDDRRLAVAAYNAGRASVLRFGGLPPYRETRRYVARVLEAERRYERA